MVGGLVILYFLPVHRWLDERPFERGIPALAGAFVLAFLLTLLIESTFYRQELKEPLHEWRKWLPPLAVTNLVTYSLMTLTVFWVGSVSLLKIRPASPATLVVPPGWVYYLPTEDSVRRVRLDGSRDEPVATLQPIRLDRQGDAIFLEPSPHEDGNWLRLDQPGRYPEKLLLAKRIPGRLPDPGERKDYRPRDFYLPSPSYGTPTSRVRTGAWAVQGISIHGRHYALETPLVSLLARRATELPDGKVVVAVGRAIVVLDPEREVAIQIANGRSPAVVLDP